MNRATCSCLIFALCAGVSLAAGAPATTAATGADGLAVRSGDVIVFVGDETTEMPVGRRTQPVWPMLVESFLTARYPRLDVTYQNMAWAGDTVQRVALRLDRDVLSRKPTVVVICLGLNDPAYEAFSAERLETFKTDLADVVRRCRHAGARVWLISPPSIEEEKATNARVQRDGRPVVAGLRAIQYDDTLARYAAAMREVASGAELQAGFVDWHGTMREARAREHRAQGSAAFTSDGRTPMLRSMALIAAELLDAWHAEGIRVRIELDWADALARVAVDDAPVVSLPVQKTEDGKRILEVKGLPLPWPMPGGAQGSLEQDWLATRMCTFEFKMPDPPELGVVMAQSAERGPATSQSIMLASQLRAGFNLVTAEPLRSLNGVKELYELISTKNGTRQAIWRRLELTPPQQPELVDSHGKLIAAWESYIEGYRKLIDKHPRTFDATLVLSEAEQPEHLPTGPGRPAGATAPAAR